MKKLLLGLVTLIMLTGCATLDDDEAKVAVLDALENAYKASYIADGIGLAVFADQTIVEEGTTWYRVADNYGSVKELKEQVDKGYNGEVSEELKNTIDKKYKDIDGKLYSTGVGGCPLPYEIDTAREDMEEDVKINEIKSKKITITLKEIEYTLIKKSDKWVSEEKIFSCN